MATKWVVLSFVISSYVQYLCSLSSCIGFIVIEKVFLIKLMLHLGKFRKGYLSDDDDDHPETIFQATFGNRWYTWSNSQNGSSRRSTPGFDWRESFHHTSDHQEEWARSNVSDSEDEAFNVGLHSDRAQLGLPKNGPLKLKDVKNA